jgi:hypothetical protein
MTRTVERSVASTEHGNALLAQHASRAQCLKRNLLQVSKGWPHCKNKEVSAVHSKLPVRDCIPEIASSERNSELNRLDARQNNWFTARLVHGLG